MLFEGGLTDAVGLALIATVVAALVAMLSIVISGDLARGLRTGPAAHILLFILYAPLVMIAIDPLSQVLKRPSLWHGSWRLSCLPGW